MEAILWPQKTLCKTNKKGESTARDLVSPGAQKQPFLAGPLPLRPSLCSTGISDSPVGDPQSLRTRTVCPPQRGRCHATTPVTGAVSRAGKAQRGAVFASAGLWLSLRVCPPPHPELSVLPPVGHQPLHPPPKLAVYDLPGIYSLPCQHRANQANYLP